MYSNRPNEAKGTIRMPICHQELTMGTQNYIERRQPSMGGMFIGSQQLQGYSSQLVSTPSRNPTRDYDTGYGVNQGRYQQVSGFNAHQCTLQHSQNMQQTKASSKVWNDQGQLHSNSASQITSRGTVGSSSTDRHQTWKFSQDIQTQDKTFDNTFNDQSLKVILTEIRRLRGANLQLRMNSDAPFLFELTGRCIGCSGYLASLPGLQFELQELRADTPCSSVSCVFYDFDGMKPEINDGSILRVVGRYGEKMHNFQVYTFEQCDEEQTKLIDALKLQSNFEINRLFGASTSRAPKRKAVKVIWNGLDTRSSRSGFLYTSSHNSSWPRQNY